MPRVDHKNSQKQCTYHDTAYIGTLNINHSASSPTNLPFVRLIYKNKSMVFLLDSGSTHNIISSETYSNIKGLIHRNNISNDSKIQCLGVGYHNQPLNSNIRITLDVSFENDSSNFHTNFNIIDTHFNILGVNFIREKMF